MGLPNFRKRNVILLLLLVFFTSHRIYHRFWNPHLIVTFFDVGQGDSALIQFPYGKTLLVDGGGGWKSWDAGSKLLFPELTRLGILRLDHLVLSHPDNDHARGFLGILKLLKVEELILHGALNKVSIKQPLMSIKEEAKAKNIKQTFVSQEEVRNISGAKVLLIPLGNHSKNTNDQALVLKIEFGKCHILFTGDIEKESELELTKKITGKIHLLKVPHHGSLTSSQWSFLNHISPSWAVVSVGINNQYGHPKTEILNRYSSQGIQLFRTDFHGSVRFDFNSEGEVKCESVMGECGRARCL